ncbi:cytosolic protein [Geobacillus sp. 46C-IIa]|uniref:DUF2268 domain-containing protein n=1 Tax=Geobacillus sp. 46C-IIa TaxID=1963025 RepID=UPI0009BCDC09|nr:DUF2268 domain-containing protein [Geobacillus sp. 46C-IIa]OQP05605.1 cytosolic protein [Geobacillus sp. 46C-IIa]QNU27214.1 DUF2268 domain-containing protein [Geobacillus sp. 46C-IIa]
MGLFPTDRWLEQDRGDPLRLCARFVPLFSDASARDIHQYLRLYGMYRSARQAVRLLPDMKAQRLWERVGRHYDRQRAAWRGPDVPVFLLPADDGNEKLTREFHGKGGVAFADKLFFFLLPDHGDDEIAALVAHEYNHVYRLQKLPNGGKEATLLDAVIMEGLAEHAVAETVGAGQCASWTTYYTDRELERFWRRYIAPNQDVSVSHPLSARLLYGLGWYPKMGGYAVGHAIVRRCLEGGHSLTELMGTEAKQIVALAGFADAE